MGLESVPEWNPDELECALNGLELLPDEADENATQPVPQSMKFNFTLMADASGMEMLEGALPEKVISQPIPLEAAQTTIPSSSMKRKQSLNVTRDENAEFIDSVEAIAAHRQDVSSNNDETQQSILAIEAREDSQNGHETETADFAVASSSWSTSNPIDVTVTAPRAPTTRTKNLRPRAASFAGLLATPAVVAYQMSKSKRGTNRFTCHCRRTFMNKKALQDHLKTHSA